MREYPDLYLPVLTTILLVRKKKVARKIVYCKSVHCKYRVKGRLNIKPRNLIYRRKVLESRYLVWNPLFIYHIKNAMFDCTIYYSFIYGSMALYSAWDINRTMIMFNPLLFYLWQHGFIFCLEYNRPWVMFNLLIFYLWQHGFIFCLGYNRWRVMSNLLIFYLWQHGFIFCLGYNKIKNCINFPSLSKVYHTGWVRRSVA